MSRRDRRGGSRPGAGRPKGSGHKASEDVRRHRVVILLSDIELSKLERLAKKRELPLGTAAYEIVVRALRRRDLTTFA